MSNPDPATRAAIAAHRFGLAEPELAPLRGDPAGWLLAQIGPAEPQGGPQLADSTAALKTFIDYQRAQREARRANPAREPRREPAMAGAMADAMAGGDTMAPPPAGAANRPGARSAEQPFVEHFRRLVQDDQRARVATAASTQRPFAERLALFWANHFTVSMAKPSVRGMVGAFEREAIRPQLAGRFEDLLRASSTHPVMLRYLDNDQSAGPRSRVVQRLARLPRAGDNPDAPRLSGLNENLAREILELHTLGVAGGGAAYGGWGGYTQADVTEFARVLTGWRIPLQELAAGRLPEGRATRFDPAWHDPGPKTVLGKTYAEGPDALHAVLHDLARHPSTARFVAYKLARHVVADDPAPALVARLERRFRDTEGDLAELARALVAAPEAWETTPAKLKSPEEHVLSSLRMLRVEPALLQRGAPDAGIAALGQRLQAAPSPAGWPDRADEWLGPDAMWKRVEWTTRLAERTGRQVDARALARNSLGPLLHADTALQIERAADGPQALALLLLAPEFQRR